MLNFHLVRQGKQDLAQTEFSGRKVMITSILVSLYTLHEKLKWY